MNTLQLSPESAADAVVARVLELIDSEVSSPIILIDGRAGSGKSTLADLVQRGLFREGDSLPRIVHMDDLYEGWGGLQAGVDYLLRFVLGPLGRGVRAEWQEFDWAMDARVGRWREFAGGTPLIVEGCGALSLAASEFANLRVWLEVDEAVRHERWLTRDGHKFDSQWGVWAAQELEFYARERSAELADLLVTDSTL